MKVNLNVVKGAQPNKNQAGREASPRSQFRGAVDAPEQQSSSSFAGVALLFVFAGSVAAFAAGAFKLAGNDDGATKHASVDASTVRASLKEDVDQKKKVLQQQDALKRKLQM